MIGDVLLLAILTPLATHALHHPGMQDHAAASTTPLRERDTQGMS